MLRLATGMLGRAQLRSYFVLVLTGQTQRFCLAFTALNDGVRRPGHIFDIALHEGIYALLIAIGLIWGCILVILGGMEVDFRASASV